MIWRGTALLLGACALVFVALLMRSMGEWRSPLSIDNLTPHVRVGDTIVRVERADTPLERERGLSGRDGLDENEGMLFVFEQDGRHAFWMKGMRFAIDILWIADNGRVVHIERDIGPETYPKTFVPPEPARYVLEVPAGFATAHGVRVGEIIGW